MYVFGYVNVKFFCVLRINRKVWTASRFLYYRGTTLLDATDYANRSC